MDKDLIFESFRNCVSSKKCDGCKWKACKLLKNQRVSIPIDLALAVTAFMAETFKENNNITTLQK